MTYVLQTIDICLDELHTRSCLKIALAKTFSTEGQEAALVLLDFEQTQLGRVQKNYLNLASHKNFSEKVVISMCSPWNAMGI